MSEKNHLSFWDTACVKQPPVRRLYLLRVLFLAVPALALVYFFEVQGLAPIGAVPLMYLSLHGWFAFAYARNKSMGLVLVGNILSAVSAAAITGFFVYLLVFIHGLNTLWRLLGGPYSVLTVWIMGSFVTELILSLIFAVMIFRRMPPRPQETVEDTLPEEQDPADAESVEPAAENPPREGQGTHDGTLTKTEPQDPDAPNQDVL